MGCGGSDPGVPYLKNTQVHHVKCKSSTRFSLNGGVERQVKSSQIKIANQILRIQIHQGLLRLHQMQNSRFHSIIVEGMSFADIYSHRFSTRHGSSVVSRLYIYICARTKFTVPAPRLSAIIPYALDRREYFYVRGDYY